MKKINLASMAVVLGLALGAPAVADTLKAPTPVKPAQPAAKSPTTPVTPKAAAPAANRGAPGSDSTVQTEISGHLRGCGAAPGDISITVNGARSDKARVFQGPGGLQYKITGLSAGTKQIAPRSSTGACSTGTWVPASRTVVLRGRDDVHINQDFSYRAPMPDLVPGIPDATTGTVSVRNIGNGHAKASKLILLCGVQLAGRQDEIHGCNAVLPADISAYRDPAFPGQVIAKIPPLPPGGIYKHKLTFWPASLRNGSYGFQVHADHGREVIESNEENNTARTPKIEVNRPVKPPTSTDLSADIYLVTSAQGAPRVPLDVKVGQPLFIQVAGSGRNGVLVNRIGWAGINTGNPGMDRLTTANSGDRPSDAHTWSIGAINKPGDFTFCGYAWSTRDEQATRCVVVSVTNTVGPDLVVHEALVNVYDPFYIVNSSWHVQNWDAITSFPPLFISYTYGCCIATIRNKGSVRVDAWGLTLILNGKKYTSTITDPLGPGGEQMRSFSNAVVSPGIVWRAYQQDGNITGTVTVDEEGSIAETNERNNSKAANVIFRRVSPTNLQVTRAGAGVRLVWVPGNFSRPAWGYDGHDDFVNVHGYHIGVRYTYTAFPDKPASRLYTVNALHANVNSFTIQELPWRDVVDHRVCFRVVAYKSASANTLVSAPSNEVCLTVSN